MGRGQELASWQELSVHAVPSGRMQGGGGQRPDTLMRWGYRLVPGFTSGPLDAPSTWHQNDRQHRKMHACPASPAGRRTCEGVLLDWTGTFADFNAHNLASLHVFEMLQGWAVMRQGWARSGAGASPPRCWGTSMEVAEARWTLQPCLPEYIVQACRNA